MKSLIVCLVCLASLGLKRFRIQGVQGPRGLGFEGFRVYFRVREV